MTERELFLAILDLPDPAGRTAYLDQVCGNNKELRKRVESLILSHEAAGNFLSIPAVTPPDDEDALTFLAPPTRADSLGRIGHYEVLEILGRGGFGIVFRAFDEMLQRVVAVKVMAPHMAATSPARKRFLREARTSAQVRHENVVQVHEVGEHPLPYLVMEFIPGETLEARLDRTGPLDIAEVLRIGRQIAEGLAAAHATELIHRDIKPANVLIESGQRVKITDFGLARAADDASISQSGIIAGTPMYMAPEQALGHSLDQRADLFSLGSVLYQMVAGRPPFRANGTLAVLKRVAEDTPRDIREIIPETPQWLCDIISRLHEKNPADRFQSAREVADLLADCEAQLKAGSKLKDFSRIPRRKRQGSGRAKWVAAAILLLPLIAVTATEFAGATHLFREQQATRDTIEPGAEPVPPGQIVKPAPTPGEVIRKESPSPTAAEPLTDAEAQRIAALPVAEQIEEVRKELKRRNPEFDGTLKTTVQDDTVTGLEFLCDRVTDISPVRAFPKLTSLNCRGGGQTRGILADLTPLKGLQLKTLHVSISMVSDLTPLRSMPLTHLYCDNTAVSDLSPLEGMSLKGLNCSYTKVSSLAALQGMSLMVLWCNHTDVADLSPLKGMQLDWITIHETKVTDLSALTGMPLTRIYLSFEPKRDGDFLRSFTTLQQINDKPAAEFLKDADKP